MQHAANAAIQVLSQRTHPSSVDDAPVGIALVGLAGYGEAYLKASLPPEVSRGRVRLVAGVDPRPPSPTFADALAARGVPTYTSLDALWADAAVADKVELVCLATPIHLHRAMTVDALARGRHVLCEKPLAGDVGEALAMRDAARQRPDLVVGVGYQWSFSSAIGRLKRDAIAGRFGRAVRFRTLLTMPRPLDYFTRNRWAGRCRSDDGAPVFDSPANNAAAHHLHNMLYVGGSAQDRALTPTRVTAELARVNDIENYDTAAIRVETRENVEVLFYTSHATTRKVGPLAVFEYERATVRFDGDGEGRVRATLHDAGHGAEGGEVIDYGNPDADKFEKLWQTAAAVRDPSKRPVVCGIDAALPHAQVIAAAQRALVNTVPTSLAGVEESGGETYRVIHGVAEVLEQAHARGQMPSACGATWATRGQGVDVPNADATRDADRRLEGAASR